jgi:replicative DNA helicase
MITEQEGITIASDDFIEQLIKHIARDKSVYDKAKQYSLTGKDFTLNDVFGSPVYAALTDAIMANGPMDMSLLCSLVNTKIDNNEIPVSQLDNTAALIDYIYAGELSPDYFKNNLLEFVKAKRVQKATFELKDDPNRLIQTLEELNIKLNVEDVLNKVVFLNPFKKPVFKSNQDMNGTGLLSVDEHIKGLGLSEFALIIGYSGGGKTVLGINIASNNALLGTRAQFISCEEDEIQISQRCYSKFFEIPYTELHQGKATPQLEEMFKDPSLESKRLTLADNLNLVGLKGLTPVTVDQIHEVQLRKFEKDGFIPEVVVVDQLQFIEPKVQRKGMSPWEMEKVVAAELDELSHRTIDGKKFALWVLHQAKGKLRKHFSREEIDGFKGIIHKADLVLGIGRDGQKANEVDIFSLKVRHCGDFGVTLGADFKYMRFVDRARRGLAMEGYDQVNKTDGGLPSLPETLPAPPDMPPAPPEMG